MTKKKNEFFGDLEEVSTNAEPVTTDVTETIEETDPVFEPLEVTVDANEVGYTHTALGMYQDNRGRYQIAKVKFDPINKLAGSVEELGEASMDRLSAEEVFKMSVVRENVFSN
tara:strand:+ start:9193 stop:9531 length:339 start_codon:yes stop_codon:yes gene_type:complete